MYINSIVFIFLFLPLSAGVYYLLKDKYKQAALLLLSLLFYTLNSLSFLPVLFALMAMDIILGMKMSSGKAGRKSRVIMLVSGITVNTAVLVLYKFIGEFSAGIPSDNFFLSGLLTFPIGLSFFVFKGISYLSDVYTGKIVPDRELTGDLLYLSFFPQIQSGPISRRSDMVFKGNSIITVSEGIYRFMTGFCKKVLLADILALASNAVFDADTSMISPFCAWLAAICWSLELYYDFSGYSDMAIGVTKIFGYDCPENFEYPYTTDSVSGFWRKWHITLGAWFRDYVYIPLGGSRCSKARCCFNLLAVWLLTGFWHGTSLNFIVWGLGHFVLILFEKLTGLPKRIRSRFGKAIYRVVVLLEINFLWVIFRCRDLKQGLGFIASMVFPGQYSQMWDKRALYILQNNKLFIIAGILLCIPIVPFINKLCEKHKALGTTVAVIRPVLIFTLFVLSLSFVVSGINNPFAYANF